MVAQSQKKSGWIRWVLLTGLIAGVFLVFRFTSLSISDFTPEKIKLFIQQFGVMSPIVFILIYSLRAVILVLPVGIMSLAGGLAFGKWWGTLFILIGATLGSCLSFLMARYLGRGFIEKLGVLKKGKLRNLEEGVEKNGLRMILFMRLIPLFQYDAVNFGSGLSKMKFRDYALGSFIGMIPGGFINALLGSSLENVISLQFFIALGIFILLMFIPAIYKKIKQHKEEPLKQKGDMKSDANKVKSVKGRCPECGTKIGPIALFSAWDAWGQFICPNCGKTIRFTAWLFMVLLLFALLYGVLRFTLYLFEISLNLWLIFILAFILSLFVLLILSRIWRISESKSRK